MIRKFLVSIFADHHREHVVAVMRESKLIVQGYMAGLFIEMGIITLINYAGFLIIGITRSIRQTVKKILKRKSTYTIKYLCKK